MIVLRPWHATLATIALLASFTAGRPFRTMQSTIPTGGVLVVVEAQIPATLNPAQSQALATFDIDSPVFDSLVYLDDRDRFQDDLATGYTRDAMGLHWKFHLDRRATWQDGFPLTARDIVYTCDLINNPKFGAASTLGFDHIKAVRAIGDYEVDFTLTSPYAPFLAYVGGQAILPQHILGKLRPENVKTDVAYNKMPLGSGPFRITEYASGDHITETAYTGYFRGAPHLAKIIFRSVPNNNTLTNQLQTGEVGLAGLTSSLSARQFNLLKRLPGIVTYNTQGSRWWHLDLIESGFFQDPAVRRALAYVSPKQRIIDQVALGYGTVADADQLPGTPYYNPAIHDSYPYNPAGAARLLTGDGFHRGSDGIWRKGGKPLAITLWGSSNSSDAKLAMQIIEQAWDTLGVQTTTKLVDDSLLYGTGVGPLNGPDRFRSPGLNAVYDPWISSAEPDDTYYWASNQIPNKTMMAGGNSDGYVNPEIDRLTAQGVQTIDAQKRATIYRRIQTILARDQPDIFLYWSRSLTAATGKLHGYDPTPYNFTIGWNAKDWYLMP